jgi:hypothetical protein
MKVIDKFRRKLRRQRVTTSLLITLSAALSIGLLVNKMAGLSLVESGLIASGVFCLLIFLYYLSGSFSLPPPDVISRFLDRSYPVFEDSSSLYLKSNLNRLEKLQLMRIEQKLEAKGGDIKLPNKRLFRSLLLSISLVAFTILVTVIPTKSGPVDGITGEEEHQSESLSGSRERYDNPVIQSVEVYVNPPGYTNLEPRVVNGGTVTAMEMSALSWSVEISGDVNEASLIFNDRDRIQLTSDEGLYSGEMTAENRLIYRISASSPDTTIYTNYYSVDVTEDLPPRFSVTAPSQIRTMLTETNREVGMSIQILDDYGIDDISLYSTLARGSGESVRFREQRMEFDRLSGLGTPRAEASIILNADSLGMTPGDELYIYAAASDNHPDEQTNRSDTYIVVVEDTTRSQPLMAGNIVIDLLPEDFRSQRQIIVDTEQLIDEKDQINDEQFKTRSRRIGRDQEMLMLDFGQYMSMESEAASDGSGMTNAGHAGHDHEGGTETELDGEGQETSQSSAASAIPDEFFHDHGSPEMNTLFAESPRALLRRALNEMFQASRFLLTDQPEEALAYEYRALEYLQEAQQADRRYVRRAGLDGIPIPEDEKRLTGEIDDFANPENNYRADRNLPPLVFLEQQLRENQFLNDETLTRGSEAIGQAAISESDKLYLLNRLGRLNNSDDTSIVREQLITKLSEINSNRQRNPSPKKVPSLNLTSNNR